jgi:hypothetical protein
MNEEVFDSLYFQLQGFPPVEIEDRGFKDKVILGFQVFRLGHDKLTLCHVEIDGIQQSHFIFFAGILKRFLHGSQGFL